eukprot:Gregarina_sp_Pseudo_9__1154@NODE_175_length_3827_cov_30_686114_g161_i0_p1_GENE_NODE_175_length_3827_cov_30_686114_g161_i0NODE_175_length_3827_cov_30_686114_g161_i0_p1_ORF_typecomplete_len810_score103_96Peptidase_S8/PF00082_22/6_7e55p25alpha/PF05517_12/23p25alpha/PF05517_12/45_NODE_175_length_3827_cov_30_686114_g161_i013163745
MHALTWLLAARLALCDDSPEPTWAVVNITDTSKAASELVPEFHYDKIFIKFDPECLSHSEVDLISHFKQAISESQRVASGEQDTKNGSAFASLDRFNATSVTAPEFGSGGLELQDASKAVVPHLPEPDIFENILKTHMSDAKVVVGSSFMEPKIHDNGITDGPAGTTATAQKRLLGSIPRTTREDEILSAFHLLAATSLVGHEHISELVSLERKGKYQEVVDLIKRENRMKVDDDKFVKALTKLGNKHRTREEKTLQYIRSLSKNKTEGETKQLMNEQVWMGTEALSVVTDAERLTTLDIRIIENPFMERHLLAMAHMLPCIALHPEPDRTKDTVDVKPPSKMSAKPLRFLQASQRRETKPGLLPVELEPSAKSSSSAEFRSSNKTDFFGLFKKRESRAGSTSSSEYYLAVPNDVSFDAQWYLRGEAQGEKFGAQVVDGWSAMLRDLYLNHTAGSDSSSVINLDFADLKNVPYGMTVGVLDSGCSRNPDLVNQFWRNPNDPTCKNGVFVGTGTDPGVTGVAGDCVGYDFGNNVADPTQEIQEKIHGSSTSGLIAAEGNNGLGITGICPHCKIMCLKIYDTEKQKITMSSVVRALEYLADKKVKLSNHSYGGFGESSIELAAHQALQDLGHLTVCSAGNNGCNIDKDSSDPNRCVDDNGNYPGPFTPASYSLDSIMSIGGTDRDGNRAWFSNYGKQSVHVYAPGAEIVTLYGESKLATVQGTSFSAPIVTGMAAVLWSYRPELTPTEVKNLLVTTGNVNSELEGTAQEARIVSLSKSLGTSQTARLAGSGFPARFQPLMVTLLLLVAWFS